MRNQDLQFWAKVPSPDGMWMLASSYDWNAQDSTAAWTNMYLFLLKTVGLSVSSNHQSHLKQRREGKYHNPHLTKYEMEAQRKLRVEDSRSSPKGSSHSICCLLIQWFIAVKWKESAQPRLSLLTSNISALEKMKGSSTGLLREIIYVTLAE